MKILGKYNKSLKRSISSKTNYPAKMIYTPKNTGKRKFNDYKKKII